MTNTIAASSTLGVSLTLAAQNPLQIAAGVTLAPTIAAAIYGSNAASWTIANLGTLENQATPTNGGRSGFSYASYYGIGLVGGGAITNGATNDTTALIAASTATAIRIAGPAAVTNFGTISATSASGTATNGAGSGGALVDGVDLKSGGSVVNGAANATAALIQGARFGVYSSSLAGVAVRNAGTIRGQAFAGIDSRYGSPVYNGVYGATAALITGARYGVAVGAAAAVTNLGTITATGTGGNGVRMFDGGTIANGASGSHAGLIAGSVLSTVGGGAYGVQLYGTDMAALLVNFGSITGATGVLATYQATIANSGILSGRSAGVYLREGAMLGNALGGLVTSANYAVQLGGNAGSTLVNAGTIAGGQGVMERANDGSVGLVNSGTIAGTRQYGLQLGSGGSVLNSGAGVITGLAGGIFAQYAPLAVSNLASIAGANGVVLLGGGTLTNGTLANGVLVPGTITGGTAGTGAYVANSGTGSPGSIANFGTIQGGIGVRLGAGAMLANQGRIQATGSSPVLGGGAIGVYLPAGGTLANAGSIAGAYGVAAGGSVAIGNTARIFGTNDGIQLAGGGNVTNAATIAGRVGIAAQSNADVTIANAGTITGTGGTALSFAGAGNNRLVLQPGAVFSNGAGGSAAVYAQPAGTNVIELAGNAGALGSLSGLGGAGFANFQTVTIDPGASWSFPGRSSIANLAVGGTALVAGGSLLVTELAGTGRLTVATGGTLELADAAAASQTVAFAGSNDLLLLDNPTVDLAPIAGFVIGDTIDLTGFANTPSDTATLLPGNTLEVIGAAGMLTLPLASGDNFTGQFFHLAPDSPTGNGTDLTVDTNAPCFARGTRIATDRGLVPVEDLRPGDRATTAAGRAVAIAWIGHRRVETGRHPRPWDVHPVRVQAGAFAAGRPSRDLVLSPDHAVAIDRMPGQPPILIPIRYLLNGATIRQEAVPAITYFHVELPHHDVLLAEDLPCESYLDTGNRSAFAGGRTTRLHADFARDPQSARNTWSTRACAELVMEGPRLGATRARLLARARSLGFRQTNEPELRLVADHRTLKLHTDAGRLTAALPPGTRALRLLSNAAAPADLRAAHADGRRLGVAIAGLQLDDEPVHLDDPRLTTGWHDREPDWRWTDGAGAIAPGDARRVQFDLVMAGPYWEEGRCSFLKKRTKKLLSV